MQLQQACELLAAACGRARERGLLSGFNGNLSLRAGECCFITCAGTVKARLRPEDVTAARLDGVERRAESAVSRRPSSELGLHLALYRARPQCAAVAHVHPPRLSALSLRAGREDFLRLPLYEAEALRARLAFVPALPPGTEELALAAAEAAGHGIDALWMERHGLTCLGGNIFEAVALAEELEHLATVQLAAGL